jgi:hypothetical protein
MSAVAIPVLLGLFIRVRSHEPHSPVQAASGAREGEQPVVGLSAAAAPAATPDGNTVEICDHGRFPVDEEDPTAVSQTVSELTREVRTRWLSALQDSSDLRARATGLLLTGLLSEGKATGGAPPGSIDEQTRDAMVQLAVGAADPAVYAIAVSMCGRDAGVSDVSCQQISLKRWAKMDSGNAVPWLLVARSAHQAQDSAEEAAAFSNAVTADRFDSYGDSLYAFAAPEMPAELTPLQRASLAIEVMGIESALGSLELAYAGHHCSADAVQDIDVRRQCSALAELMVSKGTSLLDVSLGLSIGARAGWSRPRVAALKQEHNALLQAITQATPSREDELWTCSGVQRINTYFADKARLGEVGAAREALERSGETAQDMAEKYTQSMKKITGAAEANQQSIAPESAPAAP